MDDKLYTPEIIQENPFPTEGELVSNLAGSNPAGTYSPTVSKEGRLPTRKIAVDLIGTALNTKSKKILQEFEFTPSGAIKVGEYEKGVSGDIRISPNGLVARNQSGLETIAIDGDTGDAVFKGTIQTGALISGLVDVGNNSIVIDGESRRMVFYDENGIPVILIGNA